MLSRPNYDNIMQPNWVFVFISRTHYNKIQLIFAYTPLTKLVLHINFPCSRYHLVLQITFYNDWRLNDSKAPYLVSGKSLSIRQWNSTWYLTDDRRHSHVCVKISVNVTCNAKQILKIALLFCPLLNITWRASINRIREHGFEVLSSLGQNWETF